METLGTSVGLSWLAGINPYAALLAVSLAARYAHVLPIGADVAFLTTESGLVVLVLLVVLDFVAEKIPVVNHLWQASQTVTRPLAGALLMHALHGSTPLPVHLTLIVAGLLVGTMVHLSKWTLRLVATVGCAAPLISLAENVFSVLIIALSFTNPLLMLVFVVTFMLLFCYFLPLIVSTLRYQCSVTWGLLTWLCGKRTPLVRTHLAEQLSARQRTHLMASVPPSVPVRAAARVLWWRRQESHRRTWWWESRRVATPTWLLVTDQHLILLPDTPQNRIALLPLHARIETKHGVLAGSLKISVMPASPMPDGAQMQPAAHVYECSVLRPDWQAAQLLVQPLQAQQTVSVTWHSSFAQRSS